jgi:hypothetical protein
MCLHAENRRRRSAADREAQLVPTIEQGAAETKKRRQVQGHKLLVDHSWEGEGEEGDKGH